MNPLVFQAAFPRYFSKVARQGEGGGSFTGTMLKFLFSFGLGLYAGVYLAQNYDDVPRVDEPGKILDKVKEFMDDHKKK